MSIPESELPMMRPSRIEKAFAVAAVAGLYAMAALITINVVSRWASHALIPDDILLIQELMVLVILLPIGLVTAAREHISVDVLTDWMPSGGKAALAILEHLVGLIFVGFVAYAGLSALGDAFESRDYYSGTFDMPMWVGHATFLFGLAIFFVRILLMLTHDLKRLGG